jgi:hypothetical protein
MPKAAKAWPKLGWKCARYVCRCANGRTCIAICRMPIQPIAAANMLLWSSWTKMKICLPPLQAVPNEVSQPLRDIQHHSSCWLHADLLILRAACSGKALMRQRASKAVAQQLYPYSPIYVRTTHSRQYYHRSTQQNLHSTHAFATTCPPMPHAESDDHRSLTDTAEDILVHAQFGLAQSIIRHNAGVNAVLPLAHNT